MRASSPSVFHLWAGEVREFDGVDYLWLGGVYVLREAGGAAGICVMGVVKAGVHLSELLFSNSALSESRGLKLTMGGLGLGSVDASSYAQGISSGTFANDIGDAQ